MKTRFFVVASTIASALAMAGCKQEAKAPEPVRPVLSAVLQPAASDSTVAVGTVQPRYETNLGFRVLGRLIARPVNVGDLVAEGQTIAAIDPTALELAVRSAKADLSKAEALLENAIGTEERKRILIKTDATTKQTLDDAEQVRAGAQASTARARANLTKAIEQLGYAQVKADFAGVVTAVSAEVGQVVSPGQSVVTVARPDVREAVVDIGADFPVPLTVGLPFTVSLQLLPAVQVQGQIREIAPQADHVTRMRRVRIALNDPPESFRLGSTITARPSDGHSSVLRVPASAVLKQGAETFVWVIDAPTSTVSLRKVEPLRGRRRHPRHRRSHRRSAHRDCRNPQPQTRTTSPHRTGRHAMKTFNLSDWALGHRSLVWYFMIAFMAAGLFAYLQLGRQEDPDFTIKTMVIGAQWPGASPEEMTRQVTDRIEKKLEELESLDYTKSVTVAGQTTVFVYLRDTTKAADVAPTWARVRNMIADIKGDFPQGVIGPGFNDRFGDVFGNIYAFTSDGLSQRQLRDRVEDIRAKVLTVPDVGKVDILGAQDEKIFLEFSTRKIAALGLDTRSIVSSLQAQNAVAPSGVFQEGPERISVRVNGQFASEESLKAINLRVNDRFFPLTDVATVTRGYADPPATLFRFNGEPAIALAIGMKSGANLLKFGEALKEEMSKILAEQPIGLGVHLVADQPVVVEHAVSGFTEALFEAVLIVLGISFLSLGVRAGLVVAIAIPLVLAITFVVMAYAGISLQRISLGALIIALGLLVDDAMIAVEMMVARLEVGDPLEKAATHVYTSTAFPMLTGTLVTVAGFIPIGLNTSNAGEFTYTLFVVIAVSLLVSWIVAVLFTPLLGVTILPAKMKGHHESKGRVGQTFARLLLVCMRHRWITVGVTVAAFALALFGMKFVQQQFFPSSDRAELVIDWNLPQNASITETNAQIARFEREQLQGNPGVDHWSTYVGTGAPRFVLSFDVQTANTWFGQMVVVTKGGIAARDRVKAQFETYLKKTFPGTDTFVKLLEVGPPVGRPVQYRLSGPDIAKVREFSQKPRRHRARQSAPRSCRVRLDGAGARRQGRCPAGQGAPAWREFGGHRDDVERRPCRLLDHPGARQHLPGECDGTRDRAGARLDRYAARPAIDRPWRPVGAARSGRHAALRNRAADNLAPIAASHDHAQGKRSRQRAAEDRRGSTRAEGGRVRKEIAGRILGRDRRLGRGKCEEPGADRSGRSADAFHHGDDPDGSAAKLSSIVPGVCGGAPRVDRRCHGLAAKRSAARIRRDPRRAGADRHLDPQLGHPDRADRGARRGRAAGMGRGGGSDRASHAADHADRGCRKSRPHPDRARDFLGTDGLCDDGRHHRRHGADAVVPAGAVCGVVPDQGAGARN